MSKIWYIYLFNGMVLQHNRGKVLINAATCMNLRNIVLGVGGRNQTQGIAYHVGLFL